MNKEVIPVLIFAVVFVVAIILGNWFLSGALGMPIEEVPTILKMVVHGISLSILFVGIKKFYSR